MLGRIFKYTGIGILILGIGGYLAFRYWMGPSPEEILARIEIPPAPILSPEEEQATLFAPPGFRVELVASEPLLAEPVAIDWDDDGRLYVVEMRGYMRDLDGTGEDEPSGRIVVLEDTDRDGRMDTSRVYLDELIMPRAVRVLPEGVLVATPGDLWLCRDPENTGTCAIRERLGDYAMVGNNPEHQENGLLAGIDGWIYNAKSRRRLRLDPNGLIVEHTPDRGQWGLAQDDQGRLYYNHNSGFLYADAIPGSYAMRQAATAAAWSKPGVNLPLTDGEEVHGIRVAPGLNRAYLRGTLRPDGRQRGPTGVSGVAIQRGDQFGPEFQGDAFVPESAGNLVTHFEIHTDGNEIKATHKLYPDDTFGQREFLVSTDERFRPVDAEIGPDGALYVVDMYRGIVQHEEMVSDYLHQYIEDQGLENSGSRGRLWRIVREDRPIHYTPPPLKTLSELLAALDHPNGWVRDRAQRQLVYRSDPETWAPLRALENFSPIGRAHALWTLSLLGQLDTPTFRKGLRDDQTEVRVTALRALEPMLGEDDPERLELLLRAAQDPNPRVRLQAVLTIGSLPRDARPLDRMLALGQGGDPLLTHAVLSGLDGVESEALETLLEENEERDARGDRAQFLEAVTTAAFTAIRAKPSPATATANLLDRIHDLTQPATRASLISGIAAAQRLPGAGRVALAAPHPLLQQESDETRPIRSHFTWPGDPRPGGARPLSPEEVERFARGAQLYQDVCSSCHGPSGRGILGQAPALVGTPWVRDSDDWLVRIVLGGLTGPIQIDGETWNLNMPSHDDPAVLDDTDIAATLTFLRRSFGHADEPIAPETVSRIREATRTRASPWTVTDLLALQGDHRYDRYLGNFGIPLVSMQLQVGRSGTQLSLGLANGPTTELQEMPDGSFQTLDALGLALEFVTDPERTDQPIDGAVLNYQGTRVPLSRQD
jgi:glucose/arabinose dehydrogenase/mono/diheme cytochrome c family protein